MATGMVFGGILRNDYLYSSLNPATGCYYSPGYCLYGYAARSVRKSVTIKAYQGQQLKINTNKIMSFLLFPSVRSNAPSSK